MRVLITTPDVTETGGVSTYVDILRPYLEEVAEYHAMGLRPAGESGIRLIARLLSDYAGFALRLLRNRYDLVHINTAFGRRALSRDGILLLLAKVLRRKVLVFVHGGDPGWLGPASQRIFRAVYGRANAFVALARDHVTKLRTFGYTGTIECVTTVVSQQDFSAVSARAQGAVGRFRILFLARLEKEKGLYESIEAYRLVKQRHGSAELMIAGAGTESEDAPRYVRQHGIEDVQFLGHVTGRSKTEAFASAHLYLFPSYYEGMPSTVLEAMAQGLPIVTRRVGGIADFFEEGRMGFSTDSLDPKVFAGLVERLMADPQLASSIEANNRAYAERHFSADIVAKRLMAIYSGVIQ
jgi:glycosyltransferase involved in cell wall biosynthesis